MSWKGFIRKIKKSGLYSKNLVHFGEFSKIKKSSTFSQISLTFFRLIIGAAGGKTIVTAVYYVLYRNIFFNETLEAAISAPRIHHQLTPMELIYQREFDAEIIKALSEDVGHKIKERHRIGNVVAIAVENGEVKANFDPKRGGSVAIFDGKY